MRGAGLTAKTYSIGLVGDALNTADGKDEAGGYALVYKNHLPAGAKGDAKNFQKIWGRTRITSDAVRNAIKTAYDWTGIYGISMLGLGGGLGYLCSEYALDELSWLKGVLATALVGSGYKLAKRLESRYKSRMHERQKTIEELKTLKSDYLGLLKDIMKSGMEFNEKINLKYYIGVDDFSRKMAGSKRSHMERVDQATEMGYELDCMKRYVGRYLKERNGKGNGHPRYRNGGDARYGHAACAVA